MSITVTPAIQGRNAQRIWTPIFYGMPTIGGTLNKRGEAMWEGNVTVVDNVKNQIHMRHITAQSDLVPASCADFVAVNDTDILDKTVTVCALDARSDWCVDQFEKIAELEGIFAMEGGHLNSRAQDALVEYISSSYGQARAQHLEELVWRGDTTGAAPGSGENDLRFCNGYIPAIVADPDVNVVPTPVALTAANIQDEMHRVLANTDGRVRIMARQNGSGRLFVSPNTYNLAEESISSGFVNFPALDYDPDSGVLMFRKQIPLIETIGMPDDAMVFSIVPNLWLATDLVSDVTNVIIINRLAAEGVRGYRMVSGFKIGVNYYDGAYITNYGLVP